MTDHGKVRSTVQPEARVMDEASVWVAENVVPVVIGDAGENGEPRTEYEYDLKQYDKNEYIAQLETQLTDTQLALCDVYELLVTP
ncbi:MAG: hypothetical protein LLF96_06080 [Eubacteriales bacterium]|nr:hypothetical protein [Eubacteriales bacterium]